MSAVNMALSPRTLVAEGNIGLKHRQGNRKCSLIQRNVV